MAGSRKRSHAARRPAKPPNCHGLAWFLVGAIIGGGAIWTVIGRDPAAEQFRATLERTVGHSIGIESATPPPKPKFEFYTLLPEMEVVVPDEDLPAPKPVTPDQANATEESSTAEESGATDKEDSAVSSGTASSDEESTKRATETAPKSGHYVLQIASFRSMQEADGLKAQLTLLGFRPVIQSVAVNSDENWYRVRIGPYADRSALEAARVRLRADGHDNPLVVWVKKG